MPTLTNEQKRVKIAEACPSVFGIRKESRDIYIKKTGQEVDPLEDLNAMEKAEATLKPDRELWRQYGWELYKQVNPQDDDSIGYDDWKDAGNTLTEYSLAPIATATAAQRADAFLKVKGIL